MEVLAWAKVKTSMNLRRRETMESYMEADIAALALNCQGSFSTLLAAANSEDCCAPDLINNRDIHDMQDRFDQWAGNLGALQRRASLLSLEYRLRDAPSIKNSICKTITDLCISIQTGMSPCRARRLAYSIQRPKS